MGWCSGTEVFDKVAGAVLNSKLPEADQYDILYILAESLSDMDWDCQSESGYWDHPLVQKVFEDLYPEWFDADDYDNWINEDWHPGHPDNFGDS